MLDLDGFLHSGTLLCQDNITWGGGAMPLSVSYYLGNEDPPLRLVSSVRAIVFRRDQVLVLAQKDGGLYIVPGGRVERGEVPLRTLRREVLEETGWTLRLPRRLGWQHLHHLGLRPAGYEYPHPDFVWLIYLAEAGRFMPTAIVPDEWVFESHFRRIDEVRRLPINKGELLLLEAAVTMRGRR